MSVHIAGIHKRSRGTYGVPRVHFELAADHGANCSRKRVARLMRALQLEGAHRRKYMRTTRRDDTLAPAPDLVRLDFNPLGRRLTTRARAPMTDSGGEPNAPRSLAKASSNNAQCSCS